MRCDAGCGRRRHGNYLPASQAACRSTVYSGRRVLKHLLNVHGDAIERIIFVAGGRLQKIRETCIKCARQMEGQSAFMKLIQLTEDMAGHGVPMPPHPTGPSSEPNTTSTRQAVP